MKLEFEIDGRAIAAEYEAADGAVRLTIDGRTHEAELYQPEPGLFLVVVENRVFRCYPRRSASGRAEIEVNDELIEFGIRDPKKFSGGSAGAGSQGRASLMAPMPGKVVRIMLKAGDTVAAHQGILVVEAMKMQNEVQSPKDGTISEIRVSEGQTVNSGDILAVID